MRPMASAAVLVLVLTVPGAAANWVLFPEFAGIAVGPDGTPRAVRVRIDPPCSGNVLVRLTTFDLLPPMELSLPATLTVQVVGLYEQYECILTGRLIPLVFHAEGPEVELQGAVEVPRPGAAGTFAGEVGEMRVAGGLVGV